MVFPVLLLPIGMGVAIGVGYQFDKIVQRKRNDNLNAVKWWPRRRLTVQDRINDRARARKYREFKWQWAPDE
jgi:hypothetical protein